MTVLSTFAAVASVTSVTAPSIAEDHPADQHLEDLGREFELAWSHERACWDASDRLSDPDLDTFLTLIRFEKGSQTDQDLARLIGRVGIIWDEPDPFIPREIDEMRGLLPTGMKDVDRRIRQLIDANDKRTAWSTRADVVDIERRCEEANDRTYSIAKSIEGLPAHSLAGLAVKAKVVKWCRSGDLDYDADAAMDSKVLHSILHDLIRLA